MTACTPNRTIAVTIALLLTQAGAAAAETDLSVYIGAQGVAASDLSGSTGAGSFETNLAWEGRSGQMPLYYGLRATVWQPSDWGFGAEFTHNKVYAPADELSGTGLTRLELTDGHNILTANVLRRYPGLLGSVTPYWGAGFGIAVPHVDARDTSGNRTFEIGNIGPAARAFVGVSLPISDNWSAFGEVQATWADLDVNLDGGDLQTQITTQAINFGASFSF